MITRFTCFLTSLAAITAASQCLAGGLMIMDQPKSAGGTLQMTSPPQPASPTVTYMYYAYCDEIPVLQPDAQNLCHIHCSCIQKYTKDGNIVDLKPAPAAMAMDYPYPATIMEPDDPTLYCDWTPAREQFLAMQTNTCQLLGTVGP